MPETGLAIAAAVANRLRLEVASKPFTAPVDGPLNVTISIGVTIANAGCEDRDQFLQRADDALYQAKSAGRNCVVVRPSEPMSHIGLAPRPSERVPL
jgi:diguanylate cyclase (GGDEF)-like protein